MTIYSMRALPMITLRIIPRFVLFLRSCLVYASLCRLLQVLRAAGPKPVDTRMIGIINRLFVT